MEYIPTATPKPPPLPVPTVPVTVKISQGWIDDHVKNDIHFGMKSLQLLREKGVPVLGDLMIMGVTSGSLTLASDPFFGDRVFTWNP